jgi:hypothetical protein
MAKTWAACYFLTYQDRDTASTSFESIPPDRTYPEPLPHLHRRRDRQGPRHPAADRRADLPRRRALDRADAGSGRVAATQRRASPRAAVRRPPADADHHRGRRRDLLDHSGQDPHARLQRVPPCGSMGCYEGVLPRRTIAAGLRLQSSGRASDLIRLCDRQLDSDEWLQKKSDRCCELLRASPPPPLTTPTISPAVLR